MLFILILAYIQYDINTYRPEPVALSDMIKGVVEENEFVPGNNSQTLEEFYLEPEQKYPQPDLPQKYFVPDMKAVYKWLELPEPKEIKRDNL